MTEEIKTDIQSKRFSINKTDLQKLGKGTLIAAAGYLVSELPDFIAGIDFGEYQPAVMIGASLLINFIRKFIAGETYKAGK